MPWSITTPMSDWMFSVVPVNASVSTTPISPVGTARTIRNGSTKEENCATRMR